MSNSRRSFLKTSGLAAGVLPFFGTALNANAKDIGSIIKGYSHSSIVESSTDEDFWNEVRQAYTISPSIANLNNGGVSPQPKVVQDALDRYNRFSNEGPAYYMWRILDQGREPLRERLAGLAGCSPEEIAINRNATEALDTVIFGLNLKPGDEVVLTKQDYPNMLNAWKQREKRDGIKLVFINFEFPIESESEIVDAFKNAFTEKTKVVHITHVINWIGQIQPVKAIANEAKKRGIEVLVDGAHSFGQIGFKIPELGCDYFGTSLHKWLSAPFGTGMLWVKKEKISKIWPLFPGDKPESDDIRKFETQGTRSFPTEQATGQAITFHEAIGIDRKEARLRLLKNYWTKKASEIEGVKVFTSYKPEFACAIAGVSVTGYTLAELDQALFNRFKIFTVAIDWENIKLVRVTPHVYTSIQELDKLVHGLEILAKEKGKN